MRIKFQSKNKVNRLRTLFYSHKKRLPFSFNSLRVCEFEMIALHILFTLPKYINICTVTDTGICIAIRVWYREKKCRKAAVFVVIVTQCTIVKQNAMNVNNAWNRLSHHKHTSTSKQPNGISKVLSVSMHTCTAHWQQRQRWHIWDAVYSVAIPFTCWRKKKHSIDAHGIVATNQAPH